MEEKTFFKYICVQIRVEKSIVRFLYLLLLSSSPADVSKMKQNSTAIKVATVKAIKTNWLDLHSRKHMQRRYSRLQDTTRFWHSTNTSLWFWNRCRNVWVGPLQLLSPPTRHSSSTREKTCQVIFVSKEKNCFRPSYFWYWKLSWSICVQVKTENQSNHPWWKPIMRCG